MPGIPLVARETTYSRNADQMCRQDSRVLLSDEEEVAAEESLSSYCKPVELYNILQRRAVRNPAFLQRCLHYKIQAKHKRRIKLSVSLPGIESDIIHAQSLFPLYILLARRVFDGADGDSSSIYRFNQACTLTTFSEVEGSTLAQANFILPEIVKLAAEVNSGSFAILFVSCAGTKNSRGIDLQGDDSDITTFPPTIGGYCLWGKIPLESLYFSWEKSLNLSVGKGDDIMLTVDMQSCFLEPTCLNEDKCVTFQFPHDSEVVSNSQQVQVNIFAEEVGAKDKSPYDSYAYNNVPLASLSHITRLRTGNVIFNYRYYNNKLQRTEVTEDFSCPFCLIKCASFKGLRYHLSTSHDLFNFEFWVTEEYQAVNVSVKTDIWRSEIVADGVDPKQQTFFFCSRPLRRRRQKNVLQNAKHVHPLALEPDFPVVVHELLDKADDAHSSKGEEAHNSSENDLNIAGSVAVECAEHITSSPNVTGVSSATAQSYADPECVQSISGNNLQPPAMLQFAKTRKLSVERSEPRTRVLLQKRQFFHSHRAQPMELDQVLSDRDSEDEVDDDVADFEDRRMLDDFVDVTRDEKQLMHMWNSFVRKQRVLADGHIPWACEAFSRLHGPDLVRSPPVIWCWRLFLMKLWNHGLLDARTMNNCNIILEECQNQHSDTKNS